jgi:hypothetical protein
MMHTNDGYNDGTPVGTGGQPSLVGIDESDLDAIRQDQTVKVFLAQAGQ